MWCVLYNPHVFSGIIDEEKAGKSYAVFAIRVTKVDSDNEEMWDVYRRYSDFHDLQMIMMEKVGMSHQGA